MSEETIFPSGFIFKRPKENAPDFVKGHISIKCIDFVNFMREHKKADGWINLDLLLSKDGKLYTKLNTWKPQVKQENSTRSTAEESTTAEENGDEAHSRAIDEAFGGEEKSRDNPEISKSDLPF